MPHPALSLTDTELPDLLAALAALPASGWVELHVGDGPIPETLPALLAARGPRRVELHGAPDLDAADLRRLIDAGVEALVLPLDHATAPALLAAADQKGLRRVAVAHLHRQILTDLPRLLDLAADHHATVRLAPGDAPDDDTLDTLDAAVAWAHARGAALQLLPFELPPRPPSTPPGPPTPWGPGHVAALRAGVPLHRPRAGLLPGNPPPGLQHPHDTARAFAAVGWPVVDADVSPPSPLPAGSRVHLLVPALGDLVLARATLPALADALRARGAVVTLHTCWPGPAAPTLHTDDATLQAARQAEAGWWSALDLRGADAVIAPGWATARRLIDHPTLPPDARILLVDLHLTDGLSAWADRRSTAEWLPERVSVHSCFPGYVRLYAQAGVPLDRVRWRPYPTAAAVVPTPAVHDRDACGGAHLRDLDTLLDAARHLGPHARPIDLFTPDRPRVPAPLVAQGPRPLADFWAALASARAVVVPIRHRRDHAAGISVYAMARAAGRPIITTATPAALDHLPDGALIVPHGDGAALARAIQALDAADLLARLEAEARAGARRQDVSTWAAEIVDLSPAT